MIKSFLSIIIAFLCTSLALAQLDSGTIQKKWHRYQSLWPKHKLQLQFNQEKYTPGDTAFFKVNLWKEDFMPVQEKQLVTINLINSNGSVVDHFNISIEKGVGFNQIFIPDTLSSGIYLVTAYTNWMRNFGSDFAFTKKLILTKGKRVIEDETPFLTVKPEGDHLIEGLENRIAILSNRPNSFIRLMEDQVSLDTLHTDSLGTATVRLSPKASHSYSVRMPRESLETRLPAVESDGIALQLYRKSGEQQVRMVIPSQSALREKGLFMIVTSLGKVHQIKSFKFQDSSALQHTISTSKLPPGLAVISIIDEQGNTWASQSFYQPDQNPISVAVTGKLNYRKREQVSLSLTLTNNQQQPVNGEFSVSVLNAMLDLDKGSSVTKDAATAPVSQVNIPWKDIISESGPSPRYPSISVIERKGIAYNASTLEPLPDYTQVMVYLQRNQLWYQTFTVDKGKISMTLPDFYGTDEFFYMAANESGLIADVLIKWDTESITLPKAPPAKETLALDDYGSFSEKRRIINQSFSVIKPNSGVSSVQSSFSEEISEKVLMTEPDDEVNVQNYVVFATMQDLLKEVVSSVFYRKKKNSEIVRVKLIQQLWEVGDPLYIIDGIATMSTAFFLSLSPAEIETIQIINRPLKLIPLGLLGKNGIIIVRTKSGNAREPLKDPSKIIKGIQRSVRFQSPSYSIDPVSKVPDFRSTIYWNPSIKTNNTGNATLTFYCSDDIGKLTVLVNGITDTGKPFTEKIYLYVD